MAVSADALMSRVLKAAGWGYLGTAIRLALQLSVQVFLARLLGPAEYGLFAIGVIVLSFSQYFGDVASSALIPFESIGVDQIRFSITWQIIACSVLSGGLFLGADWIAAIFSQPLAAPVVRELAFICVLGSLGGVSLALLRRRLDFKSIQLAQVAGYVAGYVCVALPYALMIEASVHALIYGWLVQTTVTSAGYLMAAPHSWRPAFGCAGASGLLRFSWNASLANLGTWAQSNLDRAIVARFTAPVMTGIYTSSANLLSTPLSQINTTLQQVAFSAFSQLRSAQDKSNAFTGVLSVAMVMYGLAYAFSGAAAENLVSVLWGPAWLQAIPFIEAFSLAFFAIAVAGVISPLLWANESIGKDSRIQLIASVAMVGGMLAAVQGSVLWAVWWVAVVHCVRAAILVLAGVRAFGLNIAPFLVLASKVALLASCEIVALSAVDDAAASQSAGSAVRLLLQLIVFAAFVWGVLRFRQCFSGGYAQTVDHLLNRLPPAARRAVGIKK